MNYLSVENISKRFGDRQIFENLSFGLAKGEKMALVAKNGTGKTTLLNILAKVDVPDSGQVVFRKGLEIRYLSQNPAFDLKQTVWECVFDTKDPLLLLVARYERFLETGEGDLQKMLDDLEEQHAWDTEARVKSILTQLKIEHFDQKVGELSGGQLKRLSLAKVLLEDPDLLILDEPTNHLDLEMIEWLEKYLKNDKFSLLMVTHDRYFLENVCTTILELDDFQLYSYKGNYSYYLEKREERKQIEAAGIEKAKNLYRKELDWMRRQPKARTTKSKARIDAFYDVEARAKKRAEDQKLELEINMQRMGSKILELHNLGKSFGEKQIVSGFDYKFIRGERVGIIGPNGAGKSTLLKLFTQELEPDNGKVVIGDTILFAHYRQDGLEFKKGQRVIEAVKEVGEYIPLTKGKKISASQLLERFLFPKHMHYVHIEKLSGGEKRRLFLLKVLMKNPNFLILDEPTNDLDIVTLQVLEDFLDDFPGCLIIVSHDRYFMDKLVDHLFVLDGDGNLKDFPGNYSLWRDYSDAQQALPKAVAKRQPDPELDSGNEGVATPKNDYSQRLSYNEKREYGLLEGEIEKLEKRKSEIESIFSGENPEPEELEKLSAELQEVLAQIEVKSDRWLELSERAG
jgi:ATP-binding cassette subfamily F protein uup